MQNKIILGKSLKFSKKYITLKNLSNYNGMILKVADLTTIKDETDENRIEAIKVWKIIFYQLIKDN